MVQRPNPAPARSAEGTAGALAGPEVAAPGVPGVWGTPPAATTPALNSALAKLPAPRSSTAERRVILPGIVSPPSAYQRDHAAPVSVNEKASQAARRDASRDVRGAFGLPSDAMTDVAIVFPPLRISRDFIDYPYFADLGAVQAAAVLRDAGQAIALVDAFAIEGASLEPLDLGYVRMGAPVPAVAGRVPAEARVLVVAFTPFHRPPARDPLLAALLESLRGTHPGAAIVLADLYQSGQHVVDARPADTLAAYPEADVFVRYEAEEVLPGLVAGLLARGRPAAPFTLDGGEPAPLDALPLPAWDLVDLPRYFAFHEDVVRGLGRPRWAFPIDGKSLPALTSRGLPLPLHPLLVQPDVAPRGHPDRAQDPAPLLARVPRPPLRRPEAPRRPARPPARRAGQRQRAPLRRGPGAPGAEHDLAFDVPNGMRADYLAPRAPRGDEGARDHAERERRERRAARGRRGRRQAARSRARSRAPPRARTPRACR